MDFFSDFGAPEKLMSDNGTKFASVELNRFCGKRGVRHVTSKPKFSKSNGLAARHIQIVNALC
jgi:transposase InsO family protein